MYVLLKSKQSHRAISVFSPSLPRLLCVSEHLSKFSLYFSHRTVHIHKGFLSHHQEPRRLHVQILRHQSPFLHARYHATIQHGSQNTGKPVGNMAAAIAKFHNNCVRTMRIAWLPSTNKRISWSWFALEYMMAFHSRAFHNLASSSYDDKYTQFSQKSVIVFMGHSTREVALFMKCVVQLG